MNRISTADYATLGTIRIEHSLDDAAHQAWDDSTLELLLESFVHCHARQGALIFSRMSDLRETTEDQTVVLANQTQLFRDLEAEYEKLRPLS